MLEILVFYFVIIPLVISIFVMPFMGTRKAVPPIMGGKIYSYGKWWEPEDLKAYNKEADRLIAQGEARRRKA